MQARCALPGRPPTIIRSRLLGLRHDTVERFGGHHVHQVTLDHAIRSGRPLRWHDDDDARPTQRSQLWMAHIERLAIAQANAKRSERFVAKELA